MYGFLLGLLVLDGIFLGVIILLQSGKGGGLAAMGGGAGGTETFLGGGRHATTVLTRTTWVAGGLFMALALVLSILSSRARQPDSILRDTFQQGQQAPAPEPVLPGLQDQQEPPAGEGTGQGEATPPPGGGTGSDAGSGSGNR